MHFSQIYYMLNPPIIYLPPSYDPNKIPMVSGPFHHSMVLPYVEEGGTVSNMEGSCGYIE
jgi:hypothetical protein